MNIYEMYALKLIQFLLKKPYYQDHDFKIKTIRRYYNLESSNRSATQLITNLLLKLERAGFLIRKKVTWMTTIKFQSLLQETQEPIIFEIIRWKV